MNRRSASLSGYKPRIVWSQSDCKDCTRTLVTDHLNSSHHCESELVYLTETQTKMFLSLTCSESVFHRFVRSARCGNVSHSCSHTRCSMFKLFLINNKAAEPFEGNFLGKVSLIGKVPQGGALGL